MYSGATFLSSGNAPPTLEGLTSERGGRGRTRGRHVVGEIGAGGGATARTFVFNASGMREAGMGFKARRRMQTDCNCERR